MNIIDMHLLVPSPFPTNSVENGDQGLKKSPHNRRR